MTAGKYLNLGFIAYLTGDGSRNLEGRLLGFFHLKFIFFGQNKKTAPKWKCHLEGAIFSAAATFDIGAVAVKRTRWEEGRGLGWIVKLYKSSTLIYNVCFFLILFFSKCMLDNHAKMTEQQT